MRLLSTNRPNALGGLIVRQVLCVIVLLRIGSPVPEYAAFSTVAQFDFGTPVGPGDSDDETTDDSEQVLNGKPRRQVHSDGISALDLTIQLRGLTPAIGVGHARPITCPSAASRIPAIILLRI